MLPCSTKYLWYLVPHGSMCFLQFKLTILFSQMIKSFYHLIKLWNTLSNKISTAAYYNAYKKKIKLCVINYLLSYFAQTSRQWSDGIVSLSGVDTNVSAAHSCRSASISKAGNKRDHESWKSESTFKKLYDKDIIKII